MSNNSYKVDRLLDRLESGTVGKGEFSNLAQKQFMSELAEEDLSVSRLNKSKPKSENPPEPKYPEKKSVRGDGGRR